MNLETPTERALKEASRIIELQKDRILIMEAFLDGKKIEYQDTNLEWTDALDPQWHFDSREYRIKPETPISVHWDSIQAFWNFAAIDRNGDLLLFVNRPSLDLPHDSWMSSNSQKVPNGIIAFGRGTVDWKESLIKRP